MSIFEQGQKCQDHGRAEPRTLRLYQECAIDLLRESLRTGHRRPILQLPTGAGKTRIAAEIVLGSLSKERRAIFVVPRISLIEQTVAAFEREGIWNVGVLQGRHYRTNPSAPVQIASAQTLVRRDIPSADIIIFDECHLQFEKINKWIAAPEWSAVPFVGLSATPWSRGLGKTYDDLLRPVSIQELIDEGHLLGQACPLRRLFLSRQIPPSAVPGFGQARRVPPCHVCCPRIDIARVVHYIGILPRRSVLGIILVLGRNFVMEPVAPTVGRSKSNRSAMFRLKLWLRAPMAVFISENISLIRITLRTLIQAGAVRIHSPLRLGMLRIVLASLIFC